MQESCGQVNGNTKKNGLKYRKVMDRSPRIRRRMDRNAGKSWTGHREYEEEWTEIQESCGQVNENAEKNGPRYKKIVDRSSETRRKVDRNARKS